MYITASMHTAACGGLACGEAVYGLVVAGADAGRGAVGGHDLARRGHHGLQQLNLGGHGGGPVVLQDPLRVPGRGVEAPVELVGAPDLDQPGRKGRLPGGIGARVGAAPLAFVRQTGLRCERL